jgi:DNA-binding beta-propeller fold protein YncE
MLKRTLLAFALMPAGTGFAAPTDILIGLDEKVVYGADGPVTGAGGKDALLVVDIRNPAKPQIRASLPLANSLLGPPTNLQITPDGKLGLLANSVLTQEAGGKWSVVPDNKVFVIDLTANPPKLIDAVTVGSQPSGMAISHKGDLALVANRASKGVSVLSIQGNKVTHLGEVPMEEEVAAVAIAPDGKRAFVAKNTSNKVAVLTIDGTKVSYEKAWDIPNAFGVYNIDITPDGRYAIASDNGGSGDGNAKTLMVIDAKAAQPHSIYFATAGDGPEGFAISPNGRYAAAPLLLGSGARHSSPSYTRNAAVELFDLSTPGKPRSIGRLPAGGLPEGVAFSPNSEYVYVGNYIDRNLQVYRIVNGHLTDTGTKLALPGQPASIRGPAR